MTRAADASDAGATTADWPTELRVTKDRAALFVTFESGVSAAIPAELMRVESPSAEVQGHSAAGKTLVAGKRGVTIKGVEPVGNYAVRILFSDGHDTGLFTWRYLRELAEEGGSMMAAYEAALAKAGLSR
ncbi:MAG: DUF971 domain-containing protein [Thalassobaculaceae bacterium]|nr:DUF971 domain-containing protein [Thalassobaculaceae bacterium]